VLTARVKSMVTGAFADGASADTLVRLAADVTAYAEAAVDEVKAHNPPPKPLACKAGCDHCCHNLIVATPVQVFAIAAALRDNLDDEEMTALKQRLDLAVRKQVDLDWNTIGKRRPGCPLLAKGACLAYGVRPLGCRGWTSLNARRCEKDLKSKGRNAKGIPFYLPQSQITLAVEQGLMEGLEAAGLRAEKVALTQALALVLDDPDAATCWLAGDDIFAAARMPN
jgi:hypothetical protein